MYTQALIAHSHVWIHQINDIVMDNSKDIILTTKETKDGRTYTDITINNAAVKRSELQFKAFLALAERVNSTDFGQFTRSQAQTVSVNANIEIPSSDLANLDVADLLRRNK
jgi:hypothetical protein